MAQVSESVSLLQFAVALAFGNAAFWCSDVDEQLTDPKPNGIGNNERDTNALAKIKGEGRKGQK